MKFLFLLTSGFPEHPICRLEALSIPGLFDAIGLFTDEELVETLTARFIAAGFGFATVLVSPFCSCIPGQAEILSTAERAEMADVKQLKKVVPLLTCEIPFCQFVCKLSFGVDTPNLMNLRIQVKLVKQPI